MGDSIPRLVDGRRGGKCLSYCGYLYHKQLQNTNTTYWKCANRKKCYGRAITENDSLCVVKTTDHSHEPSPGSKEMESHLMRTQDLHGGAMPRYRTYKRGLLQTARARALLEARNDLLITESFPKLEDGAPPLLGSQLPIKLPRKQERLTSTEEYFHGSSLPDTGPAFESPHEDDSHLNFVDYVFQATAQKELQDLKTSSARTESSNRRNDAEPTPGTSSQNPPITIVCAPDLSPIKSPQDASEDPLMISPVAPPPPPPLKSVAPLRFQNASRSVTITYKPKESVNSSSTSTTTSTSASSSSTNAASEVSVVYFGDDSDQQSNANIEKVLMQLRAEKLLLEMDKLKVEREKMRAEVRNIMTRQKILTLRKQLFESGPLEEDTTLDMDTGPSKAVVQQEKVSSFIKKTHSNKSPPKLTPIASEEPAKKSDIEMNSDNSNQIVDVPSCVQKQNNDSSQDNPNCKESLNETSPPLNKDAETPSSPSQSKPVRRRSRQDKNDSSFHSPPVGSTDEINIKVEVEDTERLEEVGIFYETSGEGIDVSRSLEELNRSENSQAEASEGPSILHSQLVGNANRQWETSESGGVGEYSGMDSVGYGDMPYKRLGEFEESSEMHRHVSSENEEDILAKRRRIEDEFGLRHMDTT